jgi:hypothetical protein
VTRQRVVLLYVISARQHDFHAYRARTGIDIVTTLDIAYKLSYCWLLFFLVLPRAPSTFIYRASTTWPGLVIVIAGIAVYYLLARSAEERRVTDGE